MHFSAVAFGLHLFVSVAAGVIFKSSGLSVLVLATFRMGSSGHFPKIRVPLIYTSHKIIVLKSGTLPLP